jgi:hypothetical protein
MDFDNGKLDGKAPALVRIAMLLCFMISVVILVYSLGLIPSVKAETTPMSRLLHVVDTAQ